MKGRTNPVARSLRSPHLKQKVIRDKTKYTRKGRRDKSDRPSSFLAI